jgi:hypothetical protein
LSAFRADYSGCVSACSWFFSGTLVSHISFGCFFLTAGIALPAIEQGFDCPDQRFSAGAQLTDAVLRNLLEQTLTTRQQSYEHATAIVTAARSAHVAVRLEAVDELDGAVVF